MQRRYAISILRLRPVLRLFRENRRIGMARSFRKTSQGIDSVLNGSPSGSEYDQSPAYVPYFSFPFTHIDLYRSASILPRAIRRVDP